MQNNDAHIDKILQSLSSGPSLRQSDVQRFAAQAVDEYHRSRQYQQNRARYNFGNFWQRLKLVSYASAGVAMIVAFFILSPKALITAPETIVSADNSSERERLVLAEFNEIFGNKLKAIITVDGNTQIILSDKEIPPTQPLSITMNDGKRDINVVSFSGQNLKVQLGNREINFDALLDDQGRVLLVGDDIFWSQKKPEALVGGGIIIHAESLEM